MSFSINTNIASLEAQNYLQADSNFQSQTINRVTSGLRIVNSGDDAAGLAIANGLAADQAVLTQGIQNANDGLATLQTVDGGINNISKLLDRASTLATESASSTFTGDRTVLNQEFQSVLQEINRQAQSIGLNSGGQFAQNLAVFIGGGRASGSTSAIQNGSISVDLSNSTVDTQSLGLSGFSAKGNTSVDIGTGGGTTSVANILANSTNQASETQAGYATFYFTGSGFADTTGSNRVAVNVNLSGVTDANSLAAAINTAIASTGNGTTQQATAFKNADIQASVFTDPTTGAASLRFTSSNTAFQVEAGDQVSNALLGNISSGSTGGSVAATTSTANNTGAVSAIAAATETVKLDVAAGGNTTPVSLSITLGDSQATIVDNLNAALTSANAGVTASLDASNKLVFTANSDHQAQSIQVLASGDINNTLGLGTFQGTGANATYANITAGAAVVAGEQQNIQIAIGNQVADLGQLSVGATEATALSNLNTAFQSNELTHAAGLTAIDNAGKIEIISNNSTNFRLNAYGATGTGVGFGFAGTASGTDSSAIGAVTASAQTG
ncbi:MAG TPA: hypothetical protein VHA14_01340, partial [Bryobacteraceae bacterium]|nr:hypothetical protein [Bryobacteraceae bacterium]